MIEDKEIHKICEKYRITNYQIKDGLVNVNKDVSLMRIGLTEIPLNFGKVNGDFFCGDNNLTNLKGSPREVSGLFYCGGNGLTTLEGGPKRVDGHFCCNHNNLTNLKYSPEFVGGIYSCYCNPELKTLDGLEICWFVKDISCHGTPIHEIFSLFKNKDWNIGEVDRLNMLVKDYSIKELNEWLVEEGYEPVEKLENYEEGRHYK